MARPIFNDIHSFALRVSRQCCVLAFWFREYCSKLFNFIYLQAVRSIFLAQLLGANDDHMWENWAELAVNLIVCQYAPLNSFRSKYGTENDNGTASNLQSERRKFALGMFNLRFGLKSFENVVNTGIVCSETKHNVTIVRHGYRIFQRWFAKLSMQ